MLTYLLYTLSLYLIFTAQEPKVDHVMPLARVINDLVPYGNIIVTSMMNALALQLILSSFVWLPYRPACGSILLMKGLLIVGAFFLIGRSELRDVEATFGAADGSKVQPLDANASTAVTS